MTETEELIRRYLALWQDYLTALFAEPEAAALLRAWALLGSGLLRERRGSAEDEAGEAAGPSGSSPSGSSPSGSSPSGSSPSGSSTGAASAAGASVERDRLLAELARRLARLEERVAADERGRRTARRPRGGARGAGS